MGPTLHRDILFWNGPTAMQRQLGPTYNLKPKNGNHLLRFYNFS